MRWELDVQRLEKHSWQKGCHMLRGLPHKRLGVIAGEVGVGLPPRSDSKECHLCTETRPQCSVKAPLLTPPETEKHRRKRFSCKAVNLEPFTSTEYFLYEAAIKHFLEKEKQE